MRPAERIHFAVALAAAILFAAAPAARAYCGAAPPAAAPAAAHAGVLAWPPADDGGAGQEDRCCCDRPPAAAVEERAWTKEQVMFGGKLPLPAFTIPSVAIFGGDTPAAQLAGHRPPPPEPACRRFPRLLL